MRIHPAAEALPRMTDSEFAMLRHDISKNGLQCPIEVLDDQIIDGRHRWEICEELGIEPTLVDVKLKNGETPASYVWSLNGARRHLTPSQLAAVAAELLPEIEKETQRGRPKKDTHKSIVSDNRSVTKAAQLTGASRAQVQRAKKVKDESPELFEQVKRGEKKVTQAERELKRQKKREELAEKAKTAKPSGQWKVLHGDCVEELAKLKRVKLVFADPPYNIGIDYGKGEKADLLSDEDYLAWCQKWINGCVSALTADGSMWLLVPDDYVEHFAIMMNESGLHRRAWVKWYETFGQNRSNNFNKTSRHLLYYVVNPKKYVFHADAVTRESDRKAKYNDSRAADGGKIWDDVWEIPRLVENSKERLPDFPTQLPVALLEPIVGCCSDPGSLVVDPFNGSGTTGVVCKRLGRKYIGIEREERFWEAATVRIATT